jgi:hypothetical protein
LIIIGIDSKSKREIPIKKSQSIILGECNLESKLFSKYLPFYWKEKRKEDDRKQAEDMSYSEQVLGAKLPESIGTKHHRNSCNTCERDTLARYLVEVGD